MGKKTIVLGASENPARYSNMAVKRLRAHQHEVIAIGKKEGRIEDVPVHNKKMEEQAVDTVTLYLNREHQKQYEDYILDLHPKRIIFNPGAENPELAQKAKEQGIEPVEACTLVLLSTNQF
ncbi:CoA-binding protein [Niabella ginsenosidivorans]|uniref:CoA-binding protein n=1 Tax=Niabella ginsenosidivorans TaxID=1176587 RepID=A0A1A9I112_9BACT|nr:CoA-binding protein [Niabella ginsenosidivorans]ANH80372.1 CoA-binding protein [Niabella ginsenosidivorans]